MEKSQRLDKSIAERDKQIMKSVNNAIQKVNATLTSTYEKLNKALEYLELYSSDSIQADLDTMTEISKKTIIQAADMQFQIKSYLMNYYYDYDSVSITAQQTGENGARIYLTQEFVKRCVDMQQKSGVVNSTSTLNLTAKNSNNGVNSTNENLTVDSMNSSTDVPGRYNGSDIRNNVSMILTNASNGNNHDTTQSIKNTQSVMRSIVPTNHVTNMTSQEMTSSEEVTQSFQHQETAMMTSAKPSQQITSAEMTSAKPSQQITSAKMTSAITSPEMMSQNTSHAMTSNGMTSAEMTSASIASPTTMSTNTTSPSDITQTNQLLRPEVNDTSTQRTPYNYSTVETNSTLDNLQVSSPFTPMQHKVINFSAGISSAEYNATTLSPVLSNLTTISAFHGNQTTAVPLPSNQTTPVPLLSNQTTAAPLPDETEVLTLLAEHDFFNIDGDVTNCDSGYSKFMKKKDTVEQLPTWFERYK